jgi:hypothetical protein
MTTAALGACLLAGAAFAGSGARVDGWPVDPLDWKTAPVDLSFLNSPEAPAGKRGFLKVTGDSLAFEDGTPVRFWGTSVNAYSLFATTKENVVQQARRLSALGFNLVRLFHHDTAWLNPNIFGAQERPDTRSLDAQMLERIDWWLKCLKDEGIYTWLDLHVERHVKAGDNVDGFEEIAKGKPSADLHGYNYVNPSIVDAMQRFNDAYVSHRNGYTGLRYRDDPAVVAMLISNENDITRHFGAAFLPERNVPWHRTRYVAEAQAFAEKRGLPVHRLLRPREHGPAKLFLNDLEYRFGSEMIRHLRSVGVRVPIATTNSWGQNPLSSLPALTAGDLIDAHSYGGAGELERNPLLTPGLVHWIAAAQIAGKPLTVTEWNVTPFPVPERHAMPLYVAATALLQGWDAVMQYAYSQVPLNGPGRASNWAAHNDPALIATLPAAALLYRQGHVRESQSVYAFAPSRGMLFNEPISPASSVALRTAAERGRLVVVMPKTPELPWLAHGAAPAGATILTDPRRPVLASGAKEGKSDSGELHRDWQRGRFIINTRRTQAAMGWIGGEAFEFADVEFATPTRNATIAVQSLDGRPIRESRRILISLGGSSAPGANMQLPFHSEPVDVGLSIAAPPGLQLMARDTMSGAKRRVAYSYAAGRYRLKLQSSLHSRWLLLTDDGNG